MLLVGLRPARWLRAWLRAAALLGAGSIAGCASSSGPPPQPSSPLALGMVREGGADADLALIPRPSGDLLQLALWIDAGARDASPPELATLAAWLAAEAAGGEVRGEAFPDAIELALPCRKRDLGACLARLRRALELRRPRPERVAAMLAKLRDARRAAEASDPGRAADRLALQALYGVDGAAGLFPLGDAAADSRASAAGVSEFLEQHFGPERALLIAVGDLDADTWLETSRAAFARLTPATRPRGAERAEHDPEGGVGVQVADAAAFSVALAAPGLDAAYTAAEALRARFERDREALGLRAGVKGHVFLVRGGALALLRMQVRQGEAAARAAAHELALLRREGLPTGAPPSSARGLDALARQLGTRWAAQGPTAAESRLGLGIGVLVAGGRADRVADDDPDAAQRERARGQLEAAFEAGAALGEPDLHGDVDAQPAALTLDNGARLALRRREGERFGVAVRFARGTAAEPPLLHGRAALLASLAATACAGLSPEQLTRRLDALGARLEPHVDAESWGISLSAASASWKPALALALDCALHPGLERRHLSAARLRLLERLGAEGGPGDLRAATAEQLWPTAPGMLAPWGSAVRQAGVSLASVRELWQQSRRGPLLSVAIVGPLPAQQAAERAARRMAELETAAASAPAAPEPVPPQTRAVIDQPTLGLALWRAQSADADAAGAQAFAALMRAALGRVPGVQAIWQDGGVVEDGGWAAVALSGAPEALAVAAARLRDTAQASAIGGLARAAERAFELAERARAAAAADPAFEADAMARAPLRPPARPHLPQHARALADRLAQAEPLWLPLR